MSLRAAPRREVVSVVRHGDWGDVVWLHTLSCGHVAPRKRKATTAVLACEACLEHRPEDTVEVIDQTAVREASAELATAHVQARLAARFGVAPDAVQVSFGDDFEVGYAVVVLTRDEIRRILAASS